MIVTHENQRLYLNNWNYNAARVLTRLAEIVTVNGGRVAKLHNAIISNRTRDAAIREYSEKIERYTALEKVNHNPARANAIREYTEKLERLQAVDNSPITVTHTIYIRFVLSDCMYYYQVNDNPFFDFYYSKTPIENGEYNPQVFSGTDKKEWMHDCFYQADCSGERIEEAANAIYNMLMNAACSTVYQRGNERRRAVKVDF